MSKSMRPEKFRYPSALAALILIFSLCGAQANAQAKNPPVAGNHIQCKHVSGNVYMLIGAGSNITVQVGKQFIIVVDTGLPQYADEVLAAIRKISPLPIMFVVNTNSDPNNTGGNQTIARAGIAPPNATMSQAREIEKDASRVHLPGPAPLMATLNALDSIANPAGKMGAITFGKEGFKLFNGEPVIFYALPPAHTDGDSIVHFRTSDVVSAGNIFSTEAYPVIDSTRGGTIQGTIDALNLLLDLLVPEIREEGGTQVIPNHGRLCDRNDVVVYRDTVTIIRDRVQDLVKQGKTLEQVIAAKPSMDYDGIYGAESGRQFIEAIYRDLTKGKTNKN
jgi:glyoxylase-like metal-dependent hydrolase (beta-lactamase superfamily II)